MWSKLAILGLSLALAGEAAASDGKGRFALEGIGVLGCPQFVEARATRSDVYSRAFGWIEGYFSAANRYEPDTFDLTPWQNAEVLMVVIENHCRRNPGDRMHEVAQQLVATLKRDRLASGSPALTLSSGQRGVTVYEDVVKKAQQALAARGLYSGKPDGQFGEKTQLAIAEFQRISQLEVTGLPDSATLWMLLNP